MADEKHRGGAAYCSRLKTYRNQFHHESLDGHVALDLLATIDHKPGACRTVPPVFEDESPGSGTPSNTREAHLYGILHENYFPAVKCRESVRATTGLTTTPDWLHPGSKTAVYTESMSRNLHGDPRTTQRDQLIRQMLELDGYKVIIIPSRDLDDRQAVQQHLNNIATAAGRSDGEEWSA